MRGLWCILITLPVLANSSYWIHTVAGSNIAGDGGRAAEATLRQVEGVAVRADGTLYIADSADHRIRAVSPDGTIQTIAGSGSPGFSGDGGPAARSRLSSPYGLSLDRNGELYLADLGNARIRRISTDGRIQTVAGGGTVTLGNADGTPATEVKLQTPRNVLADANGGFYFSDFDAHRVFHVDGSGILTTVAGTGAAGYGADNIAATRSALRNPAGLAFDGQGGLVIVESGSQRLRRVARGLITSYLADFVRLNPLFGPTGIAIDTAGNVYIADSRTTGALKRTPQGETIALPVSGRTVGADPRGGAFFGGAGRVHRVDAANKVSVVAGNGSALGPPGDGMSVEAARFAAPAGLVQDRDGNIYIADERDNRIRKITASGAVSTLAGNGQAAYSGDGGPAARAGLNAPRGLALDASGNLYVADSGNHAIRRISSTGSIFTVAGDGFKGSRGDRGPATAARLDSPSALALGPFGDLFITDTGNNRVRRVSPAGIIDTYAADGLSGPMGLAVDASGALFVADTGNGRIRRIDPLGTMTYVSGASFLFPRSLAISTDGALYVTDTGNHRIRVVVGESATTIAGTGEPGFEGDGGEAIRAQLQFPGGIAIDNTGNLLVADTGNYRIRRLSRVVPPSIEALTSGIRSRNAASGQYAPAVAGMVADLEFEELAGIPVLEGTPAGGQFPTQLGGVEVLVDRTPALLYRVSGRQIRIRYPSASPNPEAALTIVVHGLPRVSSQLRTAEASPELFPMAVLENGSAASPENPAPRGTVVSLFGTGEGSLGLDGVAVTVGGYAAQLEWAGPLAQFPGLFQLNVRIPSGFFAAGTHPVDLRVGPYLARSPIQLPVL